MTTDATTDVVLQCRGDVTPAEREYVEAKISHLPGLVGAPVLFARVVLTQHEDPARERPASAKGEVDVNGRVVQAHVAAATMHEAIDLLDARLRERIERFAHRQQSKHRRGRSPDPSQWHHGDRETSRPAYFPRPIEEREVVRTKTYAVDAMTPDEAAFDLEMLDHDFYLFVNLETGEDNVIARAGDAGFVLSEPSASCSLTDTAAPIAHLDHRPPVAATAEAVDLLELGGLRHLFFLDPDDGRGRVLYHRYDGHYGLIEPAVGEA
jgi:ribosome-associated translation inhibitor RaiA